MVIEYFLVVLVFAYYRRFCCKRCVPRDGDEIDTTLYDEATGILSNPSQTSLKMKCQFEDTYESYLPNAKYLLFITRVLSLGFILGVSVIANYILVGRNQWFYFTLWNAELTSVYFLLAVTCSIIGFLYGSKPLSNLCVVKMTSASSARILWSAEVCRFAHIVRILFEVCGGNALLVMAVAFILLNPEFKFWNVAVHFVVALSLVVEMFMNNMYVRFDHFPLNLAWPALFLIFIWPIVYTGIRDWPYYFLETDTSYCFLYYTGLLIVNLIFYYIWYGFSELKFFLRSNFVKYSLSEYCYDVVECPWFVVLVCDQLLIFHTRTSHCTLQITSRRL